MKPRVVDLMACPIDKSPLELLEWESVPNILSEEDIKRIIAHGLKPSAFSKEIVTGALLNRAQQIFYPIYRGVPRLLTFPTSLTQEFAKVHAKRLAHYVPGFTLPQKMPPPGEEDVLRSFSKEWVDYDWNPRAYWNLSAEDMHRSMRFLLDLDRKPLKQKLALEVGIGIGGIADYVSRTEGCELVGVDLGYAVDAANKNFGKNLFLHIGQASVFALPFQEKVFDFVYSQGVIMATYSTRNALEQLARFPKDGGRLYVWACSHDDEDRTVERRVLMKIETAIRPLIWRLPDSVQTIALLPFIPLYVIRQNFYARRHDGRAATYGWREAMHAARDRFTPRYAHRHTEDELCKWFHDAGYSKLQW